MDLTDVSWYICEEGLVIKVAMILPYTSISLDATKRLVSVLRPLSKKELEKNPHITATNIKSDNDSVWGVICENHEPLHQGAGIHKPPPTLINTH